MDKMSKTPEQRAVEDFKRYHHNPIVAQLNAEIERLKKALDETIGERDHWEDVIEHLSTVADCTQEWSNQHEHGPCIEEAIAQLRSQLAVAQGMRAKAEHDELKMHGFHACHRCNWDRAQWIAQGERKG